MENENEEYVVNHGEKVNEEKENRLEECKKYVGEFLAVHGGSLM